MHAYKKLHYPNTLASVDICDNWYEWVKYWMKSSQTPASRKNFFTNGEIVNINGDCEDDTCFHDKGRSGAQHNDHTQKK